MEVIAFKKKALILERILELPRMKEQQKLKAWARMLDLFLSSCSMGKSSHLPRASKPRERRKSFWDRYPWLSCR
jgi:hypothetical protein